MAFENVDFGYVVSIYHAQSYVLLSSVSNMMGQALAVCLGSSDDTPSSPISVLNHTRRT